MINQRQACSTCKHYDRFDEGCGTCRAFDQWTSDGSHADAILFAMAERTVMETCTAKSWPDVTDGDSCGLHARPALATPEQVRERLVRQENSAMSKKRLAIGARRSL